MATKQWVMMTGVVVLILTLLTVPDVQAASKTLSVGTCKGPSPYTTIQSAVDAVTGTGYTISVCPGTYNEHVQITNKKQLTIRNYVVNNQPAPLIDPTGGGNGFEITNSSKVTLRGLRITNVSTGIYANNAPSTEVRNIIITNADFSGIDFDTGSDKSEAQLNTISGSGDFGIGFGNTSNVTIKHNTITSFEYGIYATSATTPKIEDNTVTNVNQRGIELFDVTHASVRKNTTNFATIGIYLTRSTTNTISDNTAKNNSQAGVYVASDSFKASADNTFKSNLLQGNGTDAIDQSSGSKTAGTANTWSDNTCDTSAPAGLCSSAATSRMPNT